MKETHENVILNLLLVTVNDRIQGLIDKLKYLDNDLVFVTISHQVNTALVSDSLHEIEDLKTKKNISYHPIDSFGVAKNRNNALKNRLMDGNVICLMCDDDTEFLPNIYQTVIGGFNENPGFDVITFKILKPNRSPFKPYPEKVKQHTWKSLTGIGTIEIAFRSNVLSNTNLVFDERFGPCGKYLIGEDYIFSMDLYRYGMKMLFIPQFIVQHPDVETTGLRYNEDYMVGRGAMLARVFGVLSPFVSLVFVFRQRKRIRQAMSSVSAFHKMLKGILIFVRDK